MHQGERPFRRAGVSVALLVCLSAPARAQIFFGVTPIRAEHALAPGRSRTDVFNIRNNGSEPLRIRVSTENWRLNRDGSPEFVKGRAAPYACREWLKVNPQDFRLAPHEIKQVRYTIAVPSDAPPAGYHAAVTFESVPLEDEAGAAARMVFSGRIAAVIYVNVGRTEPRGEVMDLAPASDADPPALILVMRNSGTTHFRVGGRIELTGPGGETLSAAVPNEVVLPESEREIRCPLERRPGPGAYRALAQVEIGRDELLGFRTEVTFER